MVKNSKSLSKKLLVYISIISFSLILGSLGIFYFAGKGYLSNSARKELKDFNQNFSKVLERNLLIQSRELDAHFIGLDTVNIIENVKSKLKVILTQEENLFDEVYFLKLSDDSTFYAKKVVVFGGKKIVNFQMIDNSDITSQIHNSESSFVLNQSTTLEIIELENEKYYVIKRNYGDYKILMFLNRITFFRTIISEIYYPDNIHFIITNPESNVLFSTNKNWSNQNLRNMIATRFDNDGFAHNSSEDLIFGRWENIYLNESVIISFDMKESLTEFNTILYSLSIYSLIIYLIIVLSTFIYMQKVSKSLKEITRVTTLVGEENFESKINISREDEIGLLVKSFNGMVDNLKESYKKLNISNEELEQKILELSSARNELTKKQKLALIGETISKISHEIQNKISGVSVWVQNLEIQLDDDDEKFVYVTEIKKSLNSFMLMLQNFKKFYRKPYLDKEKYCLNIILDRAIKNFQPDIRAKNIKLHKNVSKVNNEHYIDPQQFEEVIINLLANAIYYSDPGGEININSISTNENFLIEIIDKGPGVPDEEKENIFSPFYTTRASGGGLGLAICKNIVEAHNGVLKVSDNMNKGSIFTIILPLQTRNL